jgi:signal peptidase
MTPDIAVGDIVVVAETSPEKIRTGDVIEFRAEIGNVVHRVVEISESESGRVFVTKGDANDSPDSEPVLAANIAGKVIFKIPKVGWAAVSVKNWLFSPSPEESP